MLEEDNLVASRAAALARGLAHGEIPRKRRDEPVERIPNVTEREALDIGAAHPHHL